MKDAPDLWLSDKDMQRKFLEVWAAHKKEIEGLLKQIERYKTQIQVLQFRNIKLERKVDKMKASGKKL